jgi:Arc/MetJ-type ribon-helix-helix transcriptional regulator
MTLETMQITLPPRLRHFVAQRIVEGGFENPDDYFRELVQRDQERNGLGSPAWDETEREHEALTFRSPEQLRSLLIDGIESLNQGRLGPDDWEEFAKDLQQAIETAPAAH